MKSIHQTYRRRLRAAFGVLLMLLSGMLLGLSIGQFSAAQDTMDRIEEMYTTIASPSVAFRQIPITDIGTGEVTVKKQCYLPGDVLSFIQMLPENASEYINGISRSSLVCAYSPSLYPLNPELLNKVDNRPLRTEYDTIITDNAHTTAIFACTFLEDPSISITDLPGWREAYVHCRAQIDQVILFPKGYRDPTGWTLTLEIFVPLDGFSPEAFQNGGRYLVVGAYWDYDLDVRRMVSANTQIPAEELDWSNIKNIRSHHRMTTGIIHI